MRNEREPQRNGETLENAIICLVIVGMDRLEVLYLEINLNILIKFY